MRMSSTVQISVIIPVGERHADAAELYAEYLRGLRGRYRSREYAHRALDIFTVFFLVRFTKKPLRFFGMIGASTFGIGALLILFLVVQRLGGIALADRPALLLASLMVVMGLQLFALGLLGDTARQRCRTSGFMAHCRMMK
jgi:hypothetical protein